MIRQIAPSLAGGLLLVAASVPAAPVVQNGSFEIDHYGVSPGYAAANGGITAWNYAGSGAGVNPWWTDPIAPSGPMHAFTDNGVISEGDQAAFLQNGVVLSQLVDGFEAGRHYVVRYEENGRVARGTPEDQRLVVRLGGETVVVEHPVPALDPLNVRTTPYKPVTSFVHTAAADGALLLEIESLLGGGTTALIDNVRIEEVADPATVTPTYGTGATAWRVTGGGVDRALDVTNPSFEIDHFGVTPGIATPNGGVTGWTHSGNAGLNPVWSNPSVPSGPSYPFWDNGAAPDGQQIALLQNESSLSQTVDGFLAGRHYVVTYHETGRQLRQIPDDPRLRVTLGGVTIVPDHGVPSVDPQGVRTTPFPEVVSNVFTAPVNGAMELVFESTLGGGVTVLMDNVSLMEVADPDSVTPTYPISMSLLVMNPSFEADAYDTFPGYANGNGGVITGWQYTGNAGVNPYYSDPATRSGASSPFADNAIIEDGQQVAFLQNQSTLSQVIDGFEAGKTYRVTYHENARFNQGVAWPGLEVRLGGEVVVSPHEIVAMNTNGEETLPYVYVESAPFAPPSDGAYELEFISTVGDGVSPLIDNVQVVEIEAD